MISRRFFPEVLPGAQWSVLHALGPECASRGYYLAGGTALALQLGHRKSVDLDWFGPLPIPDGPSIDACLRAAGHAFDVEQEQEGMLLGSASGVRISFFAYKYRLLEPFERWSDAGCNLASLADIAAMKLSAVAQRGARKDFIDIVALMNAGFTLLRMLDLYKLNYETKEIVHVMYGLSYFADAEKEPMPDMLSPLTWEQTKRAVQAALKVIR